MPRKRKITIDEIEALAVKGEDISKFFSKPVFRSEPMLDKSTNPPSRKPKIQRVNVDFTQTMLEELDEFAVEVNISRQGVIKMLLRIALDQHLQAKKKA